MSSHSGCMASVFGLSSHPFHGKTDVVESFSEDDFGPLEYLAERCGENYCNSFLGGCYMLTKATGSSLFVHRLYGGGVGPAGQFWSVEKPDRDWGCELDLSLQTWDSLDSKNLLLVPRGILLFEGITAPLNGFRGGHWQVFIHHSILQHLLEAQRTTAQKQREYHLVKAAQAQDAFFDAYLDEASARNRDYLSRLIYSARAQLNPDRFRPSSSPLQPAWRQS